MQRYRAQERAPQRVAEVTAPTLNDWLARADRERRRIVGLYVGRAFFDRLSTIAAPPTPSTAGDARLGGIPIFLSDALPPSACIVDVDPPWHVATPTSERPCEICNVDHCARAESCAFKEHAARCAGGEHHAP